MFFDLPSDKTCIHPEHDPPTGLYIPPGKGYRHVCPACKTVKDVIPPQYSLTQRAKPQKEQSNGDPVLWPRADPKALAAFDPATKVCSHNCGQAVGDPRSENECKFLCDLCWRVEKEQSNGK